MASDFDFDGGDDGLPDEPPPQDEAGQALLAACMAEPETDIGNGRRFRRRYGDLASEGSFIAIHVAHIGWHVYDGRRWKEDEDGSLVRPLAHRTAEAIRREAAMIEGSREEQEIIAAGEVAAELLESKGPPSKRKLPDADDQAERRALDHAVKLAEQIVGAIEDRRAARRRHAKSTAGSSKLTNMMAEGQPYVARKVGDLNTDRHRLNCLNGTIDFVQVEDEESDPAEPRFRWEARMRPHRQTDYVTKLVPFDWKREAKAPEFEKFLQKTQPRPEVRYFLKRFCGYCLTGLTLEQVLLFFYGAGRNGKSTFIDILCHIFDDYAVTLSIDSFSGEHKRGGGEATPDLARLPGARLVAASEPEANVKLKDALIKQLTGGEKIPVRRLHKDFFEVDPHFKIILSGNHKPRIDDDSDGIWRRVLLVPWDIQIPKKEVDTLLPLKLRREAEGIFAWMVEGAVAYLNEGLDVPPAVQAASQEYREESDPIGSFVRTACIVTGEAGDEEKPFDLFVSFEKFADAEGVFKFNRATFEKRFAKAGGRHWEGPDGHMRQFMKAKNVTTVYRGIRIRPEWLPSREGHPS